MKWPHQDYRYAKQPRSNAQDGRSLRSGIYIAQAAFDRAVQERPDQRLTLRRGIRIIQEHPHPPS